MTEPPANYAERKDAWEFAHGDRKDHWDILYKGSNTLMVAQAAGLVTCLTLLKDYTPTNPAQLRGLPVFLFLFGIGLVLAILVHVLVLLIRRQYLMMNTSKREKPYRPLLRWAFCLANASVLILVFTILGISIYKVVTL
jgi:hypothetical protein